MVKATVKKGTKLVCVPCAREVSVSNWGVSRSTLWCCGRPMRKKSQSLVKKIRARLAKKGKK